MSVERLAIFAGRCSETCFYQAPYYLLLLKSSARLSPSFFYSVTGSVLIYRLRVYDCFVLYSTYDVCVLLHVHVHVHAHVYVLLDWTHICSFLRQIKNSLVYLSHSQNFQARLKINIAPKNWKAQYRIHVAQHSKGLLSHILLTSFQKNISIR